MKDGKPLPRVTSPVPCGSKFRHAKSGGTYFLEYVGRLEATLEPCVVYSSITDGAIWVRPLDEFFGTVEIDGKTVPRFERIG